jgi:hypothetical protein
VTDQTDWTNVPESLRDEIRSARVSNREHR